MKSEKRPDERGGRYTRAEFTAEHRAVARALFESQPGTTIVEVATQIGAAPPTVRRWKSQASAAGMPWRAARHKAPEMTGRAGEIANSHRMRLAELGPAADDERAQREAEIATADWHAAQLRAAVIDRHRLEWSAPRKIIYDAIKKVAEGDTAGGLERAKMAKIAAETLTLVQAGERRSWGLDAAALGECGGTVVVIERAGCSGQFES